MGENGISEKFENMRRESPTVRIEKRGQRATDQEQPETNEFASDCRPRIAPCCHECDGIAGKKRGDDDEPREERAVQIHPQRHQRREPPQQRAYSQLSPVKAP